MHFLPHALSHTFEKGRSTSKDNIGEHITSNLNITFHYTIITVFWYAFKVEVSVLRVEKNFRASEALVSNQNFTSIREFRILFAGVVPISLLHGSVVLSGNVARGLLNVAHYFEFSRGGER